MAKCLSQHENIVLLLSADITPFGFGYPEPNVRKSVKNLTYADLPEIKISQCSKSGDFVPSISSQNTIEEKVLRISTFDSTLSLNAEKDSSNCIRDDTLSMIASPWTIESLSCDGFSDEFSSSFKAYDADTVTVSHYTSTATVLPKSSTTCGFPICERNTNSSTKSTVFKPAHIPSESYHTPVNGRECTGSDVISSSTTLMDRSDDSVFGMLRVKYPWSPSTCPTSNRMSSRTDSDLYPSSSATKVAIFGVSTESTVPILPHRFKENKMTMTSPGTRV